MTADVRQDGMTLVEVLVATSIVGIAVVGIVSAMGTALVGSDVHDKRVTAEAVLRSYAETVKGATYVPCADADDYPATGVDVPSGWSVSAAVEHWDGDVAAPGFDPGCGTDTGLQRVAVEVCSSTPCPSARARSSTLVVKREP